MCGIVGILARQLPSRQVLERACQALRHRGPDDSGIWMDEAAGVALGHRRLAIIDLSPAGAQPMRSATGRWVLALNGEIYNHGTLRKTLETTGNGQAWRGHSDTETLLACVEAWGVEAALKASVGMFAFAAWDRQAQRLILARDRFGEKPLYYGLSGGALLCASELKALRVFPEFSAEIDREALALYMYYNAVPGSRCIYTGFSKLLPGSWIELGLDALESGSLPQPRIYWSAFDRVKAGLDSPLTFSSDEEAADQLQAVLRQAVAGQMIADVPLGALLSGGIDSSTIVAMMQSQSSKPIKTFSIGFHDPVYNEAHHAKAVAAHLGTEHTELYVTPSDALAVIPRLPAIYDEPFADSSQIPTYLVSALTRQHVTVALSGDGGDEVFGGYNRYFLATAFWRRTRRLPLAARRLLASTITALPPGKWDRLFSSLSPVLPKRLRLTLAGDKLHKGAAVLDAQTGEALYRKLNSHWQFDEVVVGINGELSKGTTGIDLPELTEQMMALDTVSYLPDDILVKVDRAAMAVSLETRVPFLDHRVFEFAWRLPRSLKYRGGQGKWILRQVLDRWVPRALIERPKMGFGVPIYDWLRGPLKGWAEDLLDESRLRAQGYFQSTPIRKKWAEHLSGQRNWQYHLWDVLMFQAWLEAQER
jgi:asparagine synthase (glutamine-hydrolysing)